MVKKIEQISWSMLELYRQCPFKFAKKYLEGLKEPTNIFALYGCAMHDLLDKIYKEERFNSKWAYAVWPQVLQKEYKNPKKQHQYGHLSQTEVEGFKYQGYAHIKNFFELGQQENILKPAIFTEKEIKGKYREHNIVVKIDLGINTKYGLTLADFKTGKPNKDSVYQCVLYTAVAQKEILEQIKAIALIYLKTKQMYYEEITMELRQRAGRYISETYEKMFSDKKYEPKKNEYCKYCFVKNQCPLFK